MSERRVRTAKYLVFGTREFKLAAMNLKKLANWRWEHSIFACFFSLFPQFSRKTHALAP